MKKIIFSAAIVGLVAISCTKKEEGNKSAISTEELPTVETNIQTEPSALDLNNTQKEVIIGYKAIDGSRATATLTNTDKSNVILIKANNHMFQLDRKELTANGARYERNGVGAEIKGDSLIITQGDTQIDLVRF